VPIVYKGFICMHVCTCEGTESIAACGNDLVGVQDESYEENKVVRCYKLVIAAAKFKAELTEIN
jgi:hypothetical protein